MRDYTNFHRHYSELLADIYPQPPDPVHTELSAHIIRTWFTRLSGTGLTVLDVGCGQGFAQPIFESLGFVYTGVTLGEDYAVAREQGKNVYPYDMNFLPYPDKSFDVVYSRHSLEHSPFPVLTLMEWHRVARSWVCLIVPKPGYWGRSGQNHYSVMSATQTEFLLKRVELHPIWVDHSHEGEFRFFCEKGPRNRPLEDEREPYEDCDNC